MSELPKVSGKMAIKVFGHLGFHQARQRGSHVILKKEGYPFLLSVPLHDELRKGTLRKLISDSGSTVEEFCEKL
jgi:predicted RNA binding protein YcfA (HicA-like mRNA interferase family)